MCRPVPHPGHAPPGRGGVSLFESLIAMSITAVAGSALMLSMAASLQSSGEISRTVIAQGLAEQLLEETATVRFPKSTSTRPAAGTARVNFDELDDFSGYTSRPPQDRYGNLLGTEGAHSVTAAKTLRAAELRPVTGILAGYTQRVIVERLLPSGTSGWTVTSTHTSYRRVTVQIDHTDARNVQRRLVSYSRIYSEIAVAP